MEDLANPRLNAGLMSSRQLWLVGQREPHQANQLNKTYSALDCLVGHDWIHVNTPISAARSCHEMLLWEKRDK